jgi:hypothetical protein
VRLLGTDDGDVNETLFGFSFLVFGMGFTADG